VVGRWNAFGMFERMANQSIIEPRDRARVRFRGILLAAGLTLMFGGLSAFLASFVATPLATLLLSVVAFLAVGFVTLRLSSGGRALEPAIGAATAVLVISLIQIAWTPELTNDVSMRQIVISLIVSVLFAFNLAWLGGLIAQRVPQRPSASRPWSSLEPRNQSRDQNIGPGPTSQPAPRSG